MKRIPYIFTLLMTISLVVTTAVYFLFESDNVSQKAVEIFETSDNSIDLPNNLLEINLINEDFVFKDMVEIKENTVTNAYVENFRVSDPGTFKGGEKLEKGTIINGVKYNERLLVTKVENGFVYLNNLDNTYVTLSLNNQGYFYGKEIESYSTYVLIEDELFECPILDISKNDSNSINLKISVPNDGNIFNGSLLKVFIKYRLKLDNGFYVSKKAVHFDNGFYFLFLQNFYKQNEYMKKAEIELIGEAYDFYKITGKDINNGAKVFY